MTFGLLGSLLWTIGSLVHLVWGGYPGGHLQRNRPYNAFLLREFAIAVMLGFTMYGFPRWFLRNFVSRCLFTRRLRIVDVSSISIRGLGLECGICLRQTVVGLRTYKISEG